MPKKCCIPSCRIQEDDPNGLHLSFFKVPKDESRRTKWSSSINIYHNCELELRKFSFVCQLHFQETSFTFGPKGARLRLKNETYPTIFENASSSRDNQISNENVTSKDESFISVKVESDDNIHDKSGVVYKQMNCTEVIHSVQSKCSSHNETISNENSPLNQDVISEIKEENEDIKNIQEISNQDVVAENYNDMNSKVDQNSSPQSSDDDQQENFKKRNVNFNFETQCNGSLLKKSFDNIPLDSINFKNEKFVRYLFEKGQNELRKMRLKFKRQRSQYYTAKKREKP